MADTGAQPTNQMPLDNPELTSMIPLQGPDQSVDVTTQPEQMPQAADTPQLTSTIPSETYPNNPDIERQNHEAWWRRTLATVGTILGGDQTVHITKDTDGNVTMTHDPSTTGEKWGRIAQAALGGAAAGLANSQGPGGLAKATAAGIQTGMQQPQQREQQAQQQVDFDNKQLLAKANRIHLTQQTAMEAAQLNLENLKIDQATADAINKSTEDYAGRPGAIDYGVYDPKQSHGVIDFSKQNPGAMADFLGKNNRTAAVVWKPDGKLHVIGYNASDDERWNEKPVDIPYNDSDADGKPKISYKTAGPGTHKQGQLDLTRAAVQAEQLKRLNTWATAQKSLNDATKEPPAKVLDTSGKSLDAARQEKDPAKKAALMTQYHQQLRDEETLRGRAGEGGVGTGPGSVTPKTPQETDQFLKTLPSGDAAQVRAIGEIRNQPPSRYSKEGSRLMSLVDQAYPDYDSTQYPAYLKTKLDYAPSGASGKGLNFIGTALAHMDRMENNVDALRNVSVPVVGSWINAVKNAAMKGTSPGIKAFVDDQKAVTSEIARAYNGGAITQGERDHMMDLISTSDSPDATRGSLQEFRELLHGKLDQYQIGWDAQMPRHQRNAVLDNLAARGTAYRPPPQPQPATPPAAGGGGTPAPPAAPQLKPGAPVFDANVYTQKHPGKDVNDAISRAKANGMNVINAPQQ